MMRRFFVEAPIEPDQPCVITGSEAHHILKVLRMGPGDRLALMDGRGARFQAVIRSATRKEVTVTLEDPLPFPPPSPVEISLCQALLKSGPMDYLIQKTSELGVDALFPFFSQRTIVRLEEGRFANRLRHWSGIGRSAAKQSGRKAPARIAAPSSLEELTAKWKTEKGLKAMLWEGEGKRDLKGLLRGAHQTEKFIGIIGPEGGFAEEEVEMAEDAGFVPVSLGNRILRAETAAITLVAIVQYEWGDLAFQ
ncbi:MAG: 16S rRNA (uracil(1498)-N(3))-methyltransferase [Candidatus Desulfacyla sp.]